MTPPLTPAEARALIEIIDLVITRGGVYSISVDWPALKHYALVGIEVEEQWTGHPNAESFLRIELAQAKSQLAAATERAESAEADNAELFNHMCCLYDPDEPSPPLCLFCDGPHTGHGYYNHHSGCPLNRENKHPGAALLERLKELEAQRDAVISQAEKKEKWLRDELAAAKDFDCSREQAKAWHAVFWLCHSLEGFQDVEHDNAGQGQVLAFIKSLSERIAAIRKYAVEQWHVAKAATVEASVSGLKYNRAYGMAAAYQNVIDFIDKGAGDGS